MMIRLSRWILILLIGFMTLLEVRAKRQLPGRKGPLRDQTSAKLARHRMNLYYRLLKYVFLSLLAPAIISFVYSLIRDPAVPLLLREVVVAVKRRFSTTLSSSTATTTTPPSASFVTSPRQQQKAR